jgi:hypothetical protein
MDDLVLGTQLAWGNERPMTLSVVDRRMHLVVIGQTGVGKSTFLRSLIAQDIAAGRGCAVLDPHGDLAEEVLDLVPRRRTDVVVYFDPADCGRVPALNPLAGVVPAERARVTEEIVAAFSSIWGLSTETTPRLLYILTNTIAALLDVPNGATLLGIPRMLTDEHYRALVVRHIRNPQVRRFWEAEFGAWPDRQRLEAIAPVMNKAEMLVHSPELYLTLGQVRPSVRPAEVMDEGRIFIANLSKGRLGETTSQLLGALLVASFDLAARRRAAIPEEARRDFALYADEFQNFASERFASILSEARKYRLSLTLATQYTRQVPERVRDALIGNVGSVVAFRVGDEDARMLARVLAPWPATTLRELGRGEIITQLIQGGLATEPKRGTVLEIEPRPASRRLPVVKQSKRRYTRPREEVEERILRWLKTIA